MPQAAQGMKGTGMGGCGSSDTRLPPLTSLQLPSTPIRSPRSPAVKLLWPGRSCRAADSWRKAQRAGQGALGILLPHSQVWVTGLGALSSSSIWSRMGPDP